MNRLKLICNKFNGLFVSSFESEDGRFFFRSIIHKKLK